MAWGTDDFPYAQQKDERLTTMNLTQAQEIAERVRAEMAPHCVRCEIAGSIRRRRPEVGDIEIVAIPRPYDVGLFESGIAPIVNRWPKIKGELPCKYTQRMLPEGIALDLFLATEDNWGVIYAVRTGSARFAHEVLARGWVRAGFKSVGGLLVSVESLDKDMGNYHTMVGGIRRIREEADLFRLIGVPFVPPEERE